MKVTVTKYLNVRVGAPSVNAPCYQYLAPGSVLEVDGTMYDGDYYDGSKLWMKDEAGNYYWAGGVNNPAAVKEPPAAPAVSFNYNQLIQNIPDEWRNAGGKDIKVIIMDSGVSNVHNDIKIKDENYFDFYYNGNDKYDKCGHGTAIAGLIGGTAVDNGIRGIAPLCEIISYKVTSNSGATARLSLMKAIPEINKLAAVNKLIIVNCSWAVNKSDELDILLKAVPGNVIFVCAAGNNGDLLSASGALNYPSSIDRMISVGFISKDSSELLLSPGKFNSTLDYIFMGSSIKSCDIPAKDSYSDFDECSMSTALTSGIITLLVSSVTPDEQLNIDVAFIRNKLNSQLLPLPGSFTDSLNIYKLKN